MPGAPRAGSRRHPYRRRRPAAAKQGRHGLANGVPVLGAIDVGTNACRLLIAVPDGRAHHPPIPRVIDSYTANVRLGESLEKTGAITEAANPNGSRDNIAGICNRERNVLGLMPHPERACEDLLGSSDGRDIFRSLAATLAAAV